MRLENDRNRTMNIIRLAKNITRNATLGSYAISIGLVIVFVMTASQYDVIIEIASYIMSISIYMMIVHILMQILFYRSAKDQKKETVEEPKKHEESET